MKDIKDERQGFAMKENESIEKMNEVICKFMGGYRRMRDINIYKGPDGIEWETGTYLKYHSDWNWLMPVVEKIEQYAHVCIRVGICSIDRKFMSKKNFAIENNIPFAEVPPIAEFNEHGFIGNVYHAVYAFIDWYNKNKPGE